MSERKKSWIVLTLLCTALALLAVWRPLAVPDEGRYAEIGRWMLQTGDWLTPRLNAVPFFHKPPYLYWLEGLAIAGFGATPWAVRLVPGVHAALMLLALYLATRSFGGEALARRAAWMLGTSLAFLIGGQYVNHDMLVAAWIGVAIWCFALAFVGRQVAPLSVTSPGAAALQVLRPDPALARLGFVACAFGVLSKGLIGFALPALVLLIWLLWTRRVALLLRLPWISGLALFALLTLPWFVLAQQQHPGMLEYMFGTQQFGRYTSTSFNNARPWWFYLVALCLLMFPWLMFALYQATCWRMGTERAGAAPVATDWLSLCWIWLLAIVVFFSIPNSKLVGYMLPVMPPLALLAAVGFERLFGSWRYRERLFHALCALCLLIALGANLLATRYTDRHSARDIALVLRCQIQDGDTLYALDEFPYDLPFYSGATKPMVAVQDWPALRLSAVDGWQRELFEGADFEPQAALLLQTPEVLTAAAARAGNWLVLPVGRATPQRLDPGWELVYGGAGWDLFRSAVSAPKGPVAAEQKSLPGCQH